MVAVGGWLSCHVRGLLPLLLLLLSPLVPGAQPSEAAEVDPNGYLLYCPCMGRFGNQASHFLGALAVAKSANRTLVVPPFISYVQRPILLEPYTDYFDLEALRPYHRVLAMEDFMTRLAPHVWPLNQRHMYCSRYDPAQPVDCRTKQGNPFGPFWDHFGIDFVGDRGIDYLLPHSEWPQRYDPRNGHAVIAMRGAPATFPEKPEHRALARFVEWRSDRLAMAQAFIDQHLPRPYLAVHIRAGTDWKRACEHANGVPYYMSSPQCDHLLNPRTVTKELCYPDPDQVLADIERLCAQHGLRAVYIGSDNPRFVEQLQSRWAWPDTPLVVRSHGPMEDMVLFTQADVFLGNCVSSFSAFAVRYRTVRDLPSAFFTLVPDTITSSVTLPSEAHDEL
ncbi:uncharacterized protein MONBRDRAFT_25935 [Monosiga brevicollis MX1]|uniref:GDP-fucose protein O-fucosyltransferase 1 n=1 Tax=Monosiga brevicollis TaxID=81824 RepID=A9V0W7_MONBE|nr:uncharacterized protein MONBRDRAFT_25935 [Monosiga brevicollis MX1]EDQ88705.1 predicted protein [Monosiga brevicollis MX1]|eukprot:XP_001746318.1 hypothetical protein [Monosiga brevicollis MX1]